MTRRTRWLLLMPLMASLATQANADDIWARRDPRYSQLFQDNRARSIGDIVTLVVNETTNTNEREQRAQDKNNTASGNVTFSGSSSAGGAGAGGGGGGRTGALNFNLADDFRRRFAGSAQLTSDRRFQDRIAMTVVDMMPNGNLVVEGYRSRVVAGEERVLRVTGVVRQADIGAGNTILSTSLANARLSYLGRGPQSRSVNQNYFGRIVNRAWPW
jgi:flagellar L-ring protein precursor FlgH